MCGICGIVHRDTADVVREAEIDAMRDVLAHRGPDDAGTYLAPGIGLGSRRLAILDRSEHGHMPMATPEGRYHIVYNGEVYNSPELRRALQARGHTFRSHSDTEVLLYLYAADGPAMLERLNGMFAIAIWDAWERTLFVARDRVGVKPLYYVEDRRGLRFASEQKALFAAGVVARFDTDVWEELLCFRYVSGARTPHVGVHRLLPGHYAMWRDGHTRITRWWHLGERAAERGEAWRATPRDATAWFRETFDSAVALRRLSDVPVGVLLSGGLDSGSAAASLANDAGAGVESFTVGFAEAGYDESAAAQLVAQRWGLVHHVLPLGQDDLVDRLTRAAWLNDEPLVHGNEPHLLAISEHAKPRVSVLLSGEGADEVLGGYVRYYPLRFRSLLTAVVPFLPTGARSPRRWQKLGRFARLGTDDARVLFNACDVLPSDLGAVGLTPLGRFEHREAVLAEAKAVHGDSLVRQAMYNDQHTFLCSLLDRNDRMTMGASIECRVPFLDFRLIEGLAALPTRRLLPGFASKPLLRRGLGHRLPRPVRRGRKWGFGVPWHLHFRQVPALRALVADLADTVPIRDGPLDAGAVRRLAHAFLAGDDSQAALVRQLAMIAVWYQGCVADTANAARYGVGHVQRTPNVRLTRA